MILAFSSLRANAVLYKDYQLKSDIAKQVEVMYKKYTDAQLSVNVVALPFGSIELPSGRISYVIKPSAEKFMARDLEKVFVYVNDKFVKSFNAPVVVKAYENVLVASSFINIGQSITPQNVVVKKVEVSNTIGFQLKPEAMGKEMMSKKAFREGEVIDKRFVKLKPDVLRSSNVEVFFNMNNLTVATEAVALSDGALGDTVCLINKNYNRTYKGTVIGENKVLVKL